MPTNKITYVIPVNNLKLYSRFAKSAGEDNCIPVYFAGSATEALNEGIEKAKTDIVVCFHQDVVLPKDWPDRLEKQIKLLPDDWGVLGTLGWDLNLKTFGHVIPNNIYILRDPLSPFRKGNLPSEVLIVDAHCMVIRKSSGLRFDENFTGWHFHNADLCFEAISKGLKVYAIDAYVKHTGNGAYRFGSKDWLNYKDLKEKLIQKWPEYSNFMDTFGRLDITESRMLVKLKWYIDQGNQRVISTIVSPMAYFCMFLTFLKVYEISFGKLQIILMAAGFFFALMLMGWFYVNSGFLKKETTLYNEYNQLLQELKESKK